MTYFLKLFYNTQVYYSPVCNVRSWPSAKSSAGPSALQSSRPPSAAESAVINNKELV